MQEFNSRTILSQIYNGRLYRRVKSRDINGTRGSLRTSSACFSDGQQSVFKGCTYIQSVNPPLRHVTYNHHGPQFTETMTKARCYCFVYADSNS